MAMGPAGRRGPVFGLGMVALVACLAARPQTEPPPAAPANRTPANPAVSDAFEAADVDFRALYSGGRAATFQRLGPVIVAEMDQLVLLRNGTRTEATVIPALYHRLKAVAHIPLALYVALAPYGKAPLDDDRLAKLRSFRARIENVVNAIDDAGFGTEERVRSQKLLRDCLSFLDGVLAERRHEPAALKALTQRAGPVVLANAGAAAKAQIDAYHVQVSAWRREIPADEWARLRVLVFGRQMPRKHNVAVQYFAKLLGLPGETRRLVYAESLADEAQALNLLATHQLDSEVSLAFFDDPERMEIDLLGNAASVYLDTLDFD